MKVNHEELLRSLIEERLPEATESVKNDFEDLGFDFFNIEKVEALIRRRIDKDFENGIFSPNNWDDSIFDIIEKEGVPRVWMKAVVLSYLNKIISKINKAVNGLEEQAAQTFFTWFDNVTVEDDEESYAMDIKRLCFVPLSSKVFTIAQAIRKAKGLLEFEDDKLKKMLDNELKEEEKNSFLIDCLKVCLDAPYRELLVKLLNKFDVTTASEVILDSFVRDSEHRDFFFFILRSIEIYSELSEKQKEVFNKIVEG